MVIIHYSSLFVVLLSCKARLLSIILTKYNQNLFSVISHLMTSLITTPHPHPPPQKNKTKKTKKTGIASLGHKKKYKDDEYKDKH